MGHEVVGGIGAFGARALEHGVDAAWPRRVRGGPTRGPLPFDGGADKVSALCTTCGWGVWRRNETWDWSVRRSWRVWTRPTRSDTLLVWVCLACDRRLAAGGSDRACCETLTSGCYASSSGNPSRR